MRDNGCNKREKRGNRQQRGEVGNKGRERGDGRWEAERVKRKEDGLRRGTNQEQKWGEKWRRREGGEIAEYRAMGEKRGMELWKEKEKRKGWVVDAIGKKGEVRRREGRKEAREMLRGEEKKREKDAGGEMEGSVR